MVLTDIVRHHVALSLFPLKKVVSKTIFKILESYYIYNNNRISLLLIYGVGFIDDRIRNVIAGKNDSSPKICLIQNKTISLSTNNLFHLAYEVPDWHTEFW